MTEIQKEFAGQVAIVTGAAMGIGQACAEIFAARGAHVVIADIDEAAGKATTNEIAEAGGSAIFARVDVSSMADMETMAKIAIDSFGGIDILVNNAARALRGVVDEIDEDDWNTVINTNLSSVWRGMKVWRTVDAEAWRRCHREYVFGTSFCRF